MTHIVFHEKPGYGGNARQRNLLTTPRTAESLLAFLAPLPLMPGLDLLDSPGDHHAHL